MFRRSLRRWMPLADAKKLFLAADGSPLPNPVAPLPTVLAAIQTNYRADAAAVGAKASPKETEAMIAAAMQHVVQLDQENADSERIASWVEEAVANASSQNGGASLTSVEAEDSREPKQVHTVVRLMQAFPNNISIREVSCRCIANICQLSPATTPSQQPAATTDDEDVSAESRRNTEYQKSLDTSFAEQLVKEGAVEQCLGTMSAMHRLSRKGRCWAAMAVLNLVCLSRSGAARAANTAHGEDVLSEFILFLLEESMEPGSGVLRDEDGLTTIALDAALGALTGVLAAETSENDRGLSYHYEKIGYTAVDALVRSLLATSAGLVRDGRNDGAYNASLPTRRYGGTTNFLTASERQQQAVVTLLPQLHKGWMALQQATSHAANLPMIFDTLYEAANVNQESGGRVADGDDALDTDDGGVLEVSAQTERRYVAALTNLLEAALFLVTELEGVDEVSPELAKLQRDLSLSVMEVMSTMTAPRKDMKAKGSPQEQQQGTQTSEEGSGEEEVDNEDGPSPVLPTPAALGVTGVLASGLVSSMALATAVRLHAEQQELVGQGRSADAQLTPYTTERFALLSKSLMVLHHLSETEDEVATSANTVAALQAMLKDAVDVAKSFPFSYQGDIVALFKPTDIDTEDDATASEAPRAIAPRHRLALMQHLALVGQIYAVLYSVLRSPQGVSLVTELDVPATAAEMQRCLVSAYGRAIQEAQTRYGGGGADASKAAAKKWVATAAEESVQRLTTLGHELITTLSKVSTKHDA